MTIKRFFSLLAAVCVLLSASAQNYDDYYDNYPGIRQGWGIRASLDLNIPGDLHNDSGSVKLYKNGFGFSAGAVYTITLPANMFFQPGVSLFYDTYKYDDITLGVPGSIEGDVTVSPTVSKFGVRVPLVFGYSFDLWNRASVAFYTGPELNMGLVGRVSTDKVPEWGEDWGNDLYKEYNHRRFDCGWKVGAGIPMSDYYVGVEGVFGLCDLMKGDQSFRENRVSVTLGYNF